MRGDCQNLRGQEDKDSEPNVWRGVGQEAWRKGIPENLVVTAETFLGELAQVAGSELFGEVCLRQLARSSSRGDPRERVGAETHCVLSQRGMSTLRLFFSPKH